MTRRKKQPWGNRSRQSLTELCHQQQAKIAQRSTDRYKRWVADVGCQGQDVASHRVSSGMAWVFEWYAKDRGWLYRYQQDAAKAARRGLWTDAVARATVGVA
ncbi:thermonuclease family protein [Vandammella animalimorsus]|uniref:thermonuclease family protein n=1 Tax=Vandammella animalimorsus TaxID=2029117 RepID=UPI0031B56F89